MIRSLIVGVLVAVVALTPGCPARRTGLQREALVRSLEGMAGASQVPIPTLAFVRALRGATPPPIPPGLKARAASSVDPLERARVAVAVLDDRQLALRSWEAGLVADAAGGDLLAHRCLVEVAREDQEQALAACGGFLDRHAGDDRAPFVLAALLELGRLSGTVAALVAARAGPWVGACGDIDGRRCPELAWLAFGTARARAAVTKDERAAHDAVERRGVLRHARVEGPFAGDPHGAFAAVTWGEELARRPLRFTETVSEPWDGIVVPALRSDGGLYRVTYRAETAAAVVGRVLLRCGGPCRLRIDGEPVLEHRDDVAPAPVVARADVALRRGPHRLEVLVYAASGGAAVELAVLDARGRPALLPPRTPGSSGGAAGASARPVPPLATAPLPADPLARIDAGLLRAHLGRAGLGLSSEHTRALLDDLVGEVGFAPQVLALAARHVGEDPAFGEARARSEALIGWRALRARWPDHPSAGLAVAQDLLDRDAREALNVLAALLEARPGHAPAHRVRAPLAMARGAFDVALASARALLEVPEVRAGDLDVALDVLDAGGFVVEHALGQARRAALGPALFGADRAEWLLATGRTDEAVKELTRVCDAEPGHLAEERLWTLLELADPPAAPLRVARHLARFPNDREGWRRRAEIAVASQGPAAGRAVVREALAHFGGDRELWALLESLGEQPPWADRLAAGDEAVAAWLALEPKPFRGYPVVFVLDDLERHLAADQAQVGVRHVIAELGNEEAVDAFGEVRVPPDEELRRLRVIKPDGSFLEPEIHAGLSEVSLTGLEVGDLVEMVSVGYAPAPAQDFFAFETRSLDGTAPAHLRRYTVVAPAEIVAASDFEIIRLHGAPSPERTELEGAAVRLSFTVEDAPAVHAEPDSPFDELSTRTVGFARGVSHESWARARGGHYLEAARPDPWLDDVARALAGAGGSEERMWRLWKFVQARIDADASPAVAAQVLDAGRGQRLPLLLALFRGAGLDADPVAMVAPALAPPLDVPSTSHFSLYGIRVEHGDRTSYLFGDGHFGVPDALPPEATGGQVLDLVLDQPPPPPLLGLFGGGRLDDLPDDVISRDPVEVQLDLAAKDGALTGYMLLRIPRHQAEPMRDALLGATAEQARAAFEQLLGGSFPGVKVTELSLPGLDARGEPLGIGVDLEVPLDVEPGKPVRLSRLFADGASTSLGLFPGLSRLSQVADRKRTLQVPAGRELLELQIALDEGGTFTEVPEPVSLEAGPVTLSQRVEVTDGRLYLVRELTMEPAAIGPEDWRHLRPALLSLAGHTEARLSFLVPRAKAEPSGEKEGASDAIRGSDVGRGRAGDERRDPERSEGGARPGA